MTTQLHLSLVRSGCIPAIALALIVGGCSSTRNTDAADTPRGAESSRIVGSASYSPHTGRFVISVQNNSSQFLEVDGISLEVHPANALKAHSETPSGTIDLPMMPKGIHRSALVIFKNDDRGVLRLKPNELYGPYWLAPGVSCAFSVDLSGLGSTPADTSLGIATARCKMGNVQDKTWTAISVGAATTNLDDLHDSQPHNR